MLEMRLITVGWDLPEAHAGAVTDHEKKALALLGDTHGSGGTRPSLTAPANHLSPRIVS